MLYNGRRSFLLFNIRFQILDNVFTNDYTRKPTSEKNRDMVLNQFNNIMQSYQRLSFEERDSPDSIGSNRPDQIKLERLM